MLYNPTLKLDQLTVLPTHVSMRLYHSIIHWQILRIALFLLILGILIYFVTICSPYILEYNLLIFCQISEFILSSPERWGYVVMFVCPCVVCRLSVNMWYTLFFVGSYLFNAFTYQVHIWCEDTLGQ